MSYTVALMTLAALGYGVARAVVPPPHDVYRTPLFEFDLAYGWSCQNEGEIVCVPAGPPPHEAIAVVAMKYRGPQDSLRDYENHLTKAQEIVLPDGQRKQSVVKLIQRRSLGGREWVESLHEGSEVLNYDTHYLATVTSHAGILVTISVHRDRRERHAETFRQLLATLRTYQAPPRGPQ